MICRLRSYGVVVLGSVVLLGGITFISPEPSAVVNANMSGSGSVVSIGTSYQNHMRHGGYDPRKIAKQFPNRKVVSGEVYFDWSSRRLDTIYCDDVERSDLGARLYRVRYSQRSVGQCLPVAERVIPYQPMVY